MNTCSFLWCPNPWTRGARIATKMKVLLTPRMTGAQCRWVSANLQKTKLWSFIEAQFLQEQVCWPNSSVSARVRSPYLLFLRACYHPLSFTSTCISDLLLITVRKLIPPLSVGLVNQGSPQRGLVSVRSDTWKGLRQSGQEKGQDRDLAILLAQSPLTSLAYQRDAGSASGQMVLPTFFSKPCNAVKLGSFSQRQISCCFFKGQGH